MEGWSRKEKGPMDMDHSGVVAGGRVRRKGYNGIDGNEKIQ